MKKIIFFSHSSGYGGAEKYLLELVSLLKKQHHITVVLPSDGILKHRLSEIGIATQIFSYSWWLNPKHAFITRCNRILKIVIAALYISQKIRPLKPDLIITNTSAIPVGALVSRILKTPHIWNIHEFGTLDHGLFFDLGLQNTFFCIEKSTDIIVVNSKAVYSFVQNLLSKNIPMHIVYNACNVTNTPPAAKTTAPKLVCIGSIHPGKGQLSLIETLVQLKTKGIAMELHLIGPIADDAYLKDIQTKSREYQLEQAIHVLGAHQNPTQLLSHHDIVVVPSRCEAFGRVTVESLKKGVLVIASKAGGSLEIIQDGKNGLLYNHNDPTELAEKILWSLNNQKSVQEMCKKARETEHIFNSANTLSQFSLVLNTLFKETTTRL